MKIIFLIILFAGSTALVYSQQNEIPVFVGSVEGVREFKLSNGLQILLIPDASVSNFIVNIVYHVGSRYEGYGETGMAHLLEHMMFRPSKKFASIKQTIADKGASANGTTWYDRTDYYEILPANDSNLKWALEMESDRMINSLMRNEDLQKEFSVVRNEFESGENNPDNILTERVISTMYLWHNYGKSPIGSKEDIERVSIRNLKEFYRKYYQPDNATLIVGGNFDEQKTLKLIATYFAHIKRPLRILQKPYTVEPPQDGERYVELKRNGELQYIGVAYHTPSLSDPDYPANSAFINILTNDPSGIFYKALVDPKLATSVTGASYILHDPGFTYFDCTVPLDKSVEKAKSTLLKTADDLPAASIKEESLVRAKNSILKDLENSQNNTINFCVDEAEYIGAGDWRLFYIYRDRIKNLTLADVQRVLRKYYLPSNRTVGVFIPDKNAEKERVVVAETPDVEAIVKGYKGNFTKLQTEKFAATIVNIKANTQYGRLSNGMKYALLKKPAKGDKIYSKLIMKIGTEKTLFEKSAIVNLTGRLIKKGTTTKTKKDINDLLDKLKTTIDIYANGGSVIVNMNSDKENINGALDLLTDILLHPLFDSTELEKTKLEIKSELEANRSEPQSIAFIALAKKTDPYPKGHPYYTQSIDESLADLQKVSREDLNAFYKNFYGTNHSDISFVGSIDQAALKSSLEKDFGNFNSKEPYTQIELKYFDLNGSKESINVTDKANAWCVGKIELPIKEGDADCVDLVIADQMLGGGTFLSSRIPARLREIEGMSYGAGSTFQPNYRFASSNWYVYAIFNPKYKNRLDSVLENELNSVLKNGFKEDEFRKCLNSWITDRQTQLSLDNVLASMLADYLNEGKDLDFYLEYESRARKLSLEQVNAALRKYILPSRITMIYAGTFNKN